MKELLVLVRSALEGKPVAGTEYDALCRWGPDTWENIVEQARRQSVLGLVYFAVSLLPSETPIPEDAVFKLVAEGASIQAQGRRKAEVAASLVSRLSASGLHPLLVKGPETARLYPCPTLREYGDIDLFLPPEEREAAIAEVQGLGYEVREDAGRSFHFTLDGIDVDVHRNYFDLSCPPDILPAPGTPEAILLMLSAHALKHAIGPGVGIRQLCDVAAAFRALDGKYDAEAYVRHCREAGILRWSRLLSRFLSTCLGVPDRLFPDNRTSPEPLMKLVREGGNFGHFAPSRMKALAFPAPIRKLDTALRFLRRLPFSLRYAPREIRPRIRELFRGNLG